MTTRSLRGSDLPKLAEMARKSGFPYPEPSTTDQMVVVQDDDGEPVMAAGIRFVPEVYLWCGRFDRALAKVHAIKLLHAELGRTMKSFGFDTVFAFPAVSIAEKFGRRLQKTFGWERMSPVWFRKL